MPKFCWCYGKHDIGNLDFERDKNILSTLAVIYSYVTVLCLGSTLDSVSYVVWFEIGMFQKFPKCWSSYLILAFHKSS